MSNVTSDSNSTTAGSNGSSYSGLSSKSILGERGTRGAIAMNGSSSVRLIANMLSEMTVDLLSCRYNKPEDTLSSPMSRGFDVLPRYFDDGEELGFEIDEGSSLRTAYQLNRV
jgi:hypothetical protein